MLASHAHNDTYIYSGEAIALGAKQVQASIFREMLLVTVGPSKPLSAGRVPQPSRPQNNLKVKEPAAAKASNRSRDVLLEELTAIAAEVTGTNISADAPLMDSGLDSIGATELSNKISAHLNTELSPTLLFDHPSLRSIADALSVDHETEQVLERESEAAVEEPRADLDVVQRPQSAKAQSTPDIVETISSTLSDILGTTVATDAPLMSVGLDSISATEFTNALAERFERELPQTLMFDHPTIDAMANYIAETTAETPVAAVTVERETIEARTMATAVTTSRRDAPDRVFLASRRIRFTLPGGCNDPTALKELGLRAWTANSHWPVSRLAAVELQGTSAAYGAFLAPDAFAADAAFFGISRTEARAMDPMAMLVLETTYGASLEDAELVFPEGLVEVAPSALPTIRAGQELLVTARLERPDVSGEVVLRGKVGGQPFEQRYPVAITASTAAGNAFVPRLWAAKTIQDLELRGRSEDTDRIVALSKGYGVMSRHTSLLVLESEAMFRAFGVDRARPTLQWTGEEEMEYGEAAGQVAVTRGRSAGGSRRRRRSRRPRARGRADARPR